MESRIRESFCSQREHKFSVLSNDHFNVKNNQIQETRIMLYFHELKEIINQKMKSSK